MSKTNAPVEQTTEKNTVKPVVFLDLVYRHRTFEFKGVELNTVGGRVSTDNADVIKARDEMPYFERAD